MTTEKQFIYHKDTTPALALPQVPGRTPSFLVDLLCDLCDLVVDFETIGMIATVSD
jgi:hypothetical protein